MPSPQHILDAPLPAGRSADVLWRRLLRPSPDVLELAPGRGFAAAALLLLGLIPVVLIVLLGSGFAFAPTLITVAVIAATSAALGLSDRVQQRIGKRIGFDRDAQSINIAHGGHIRRQIPWSDVRAIQIRDPGAGWNWQPASDVRLLLQTDGQPESIPLFFCSSPPWARHAAHEIAAFLGVPVAGVFNDG